MRVSRSRANVTFLDLTPAWTPLINVAEGAAGAGLAAVKQERDALARKRVGVVFNGGNVDAAVFARRRPHSANRDRARPVRSRTSPPKPGVDSRGLVCLSPRVGSQETQPQPPTAKNDERD